MVSTGPAASNRYRPDALRLAPATTDTAYKALDLARERGATTLNYDPVSLGLGVTSALSRAEGYDVATQGINVGVPPGNEVWPDGRTAKEMFKNLKIELWWKARGRFQRTHEYITEGVAHPLEDLIALPRHPKLVSQISLPRWFRDERGKLVAESKDQLRSRGIQSPDFAEALMLTLVAPVLEDLSGAQVGAGSGLIGADFPM